MTMLPERMNVKPQRAGRRALAGKVRNPAVVVDPIDAGFPFAGKCFPRGAGLLDGQLDDAAKEDFHLGPLVKIGEPREVLPHGPHFLAPIRQQSQRQHADVAAEAEHAILGLGIGRIAGRYLPPGIPCREFLCRSR